MVLPKSSVHVSRIAGTALKSFTHGYAQTVVAASQSSYASHNTSVAPLASNFIGRFNKNGKTQLHQTRHNATSSQQANGSTAVGRSEASQHDLAQYHDAWQRYQKGDTKDWHQYHLVKRVEWKPPTTIPEPGISTAAKEAEVEVVGHAPEQAAERVVLKRAYSTSAIDNFGKAIDNEAAEAVALAQVNDAIADEVEKSKSENAATVGQFNTAQLSPDSAATQSESPTDQTSVSAHEYDAFTTRITELANDQHYAQIPTVFKEMLQSGVQRPSQLAYRALLSSAIEVTQDKHQTVPRVLEVYSDMLRRKVLPDAETYIKLIDVLALRALDATQMTKELAAQRARYQLPETDHGFLFKSDQLEYTMLAEDQSLSIALKVFQTASTSTALPAQTYGLLIMACAQRGQLPEMLSLYQDLEAKSLVPQATIFPAMIAAFAAAGDLRNVVETYDEYRALAIANDSGTVEMARIDNTVYAALVKAYGSCGRTTGGQKFLDQVNSEEPVAAKRQDLHDVVTLDAFVPLELEAGAFDSLAKLMADVSPSAFVKAMNTICMTAADRNAVEESNKAFDALAATDSVPVESASAMLAMYIRNGNVEAGEPFWRVIEAAPATAALVDPALMRTIALFSIGQPARGLRQSRLLFGRLREVQRSVSSDSRTSMDRVEEALEVLGRTLTQGPKPVHVESSIEFLRMMTDHGALLSPFAEQLVADIGPEQIMRLAPADMDTLMQVQARLILDESTADIAGPARFACLLEGIVSRSMLPHVATENLVEKTLINLDRSDLSRLWNSYRYPLAPSLATANFLQPQRFSPLPAFVQPAFDESLDPYAAQTDNKGSVAITDLLEKGHGRPAALLSEALNKFRNMRRAGRHPRFFAYSKLISAAAKENQIATAQEILEMAKQDVPYLSQYRVVRYGWVSILDSMVAACLMTGRRDLAAKYHQDLLEMGAAPSANTFGLYITTLKANTKTFDEASEAVKIFLRARTEGVELSSFLYNALIGKLGKARRIDDCLFYFAEMRNMGIRPTSVTYGTIVNALCRVSDEKFAEEIFEEMETSANYKPRPAPYHSLMQHFLTTKRDRSKVLAYYERMRSRNIQPTAHTYKLLIDAHATLEPIDMNAAEEVLAQMKKSGEQLEAVHLASLIHAKGCVLHDMEGARMLFDEIVADSSTRLQPCLYQAMFESLVANRAISQAESLLQHMRERRIEMTPYIVNALIHGWTLEKDLDNAKAAFASITMAKREPSTYEAMVRAHLAMEDKAGARSVVREALSRGYPSAVAGKIADLVGGGRS